jgi:hypothetical protein
MDVTLEQLTQEVHELKHQVMVDFTNHIMAQQKQISSRKGDPGIRGEKGDSVTGPAGRDAVLIVKTDTATNTVSVFDDAGNEKAVLIAVPGKDGKDAVSTPGRDGKNVSREEVLAVVREVFKEVSDDITRAVLAKFAKVAQ